MRRATAVSTGVTRTVVGVVATCALWAGAVRADESAAMPGAGPTRASPLGVKAVEPKTLAGQRGGTDTTSSSDMKLNGVVTDNRASNLTTGNNTITDGAFAGVSGVPLIVQNSGNNVLIQSATIINVQLK